jgi:hypothetical protein
VLSGAGYTLGNRKALIWVAFLMFANVLAFYEINHQPNNAYVYWPAASGADYVTQEVTTLSG